MRVNPRHGRPYSRKGFRRGAWLIMSSMMHEEVDIVNILLPDQTRSYCVKYQRGRYDELRNL
jgi:hypothetical protein